MLIGLWVLTLGGCGEPGLRSTPDELVDNLYVVQRPDGPQVGYMNVVSGRFELRGRCLVLVVVGEPYTPIFSTRAGVEVMERGIRFSGRFIEYGEPRRFPHIGSPSTLADGAGGCPRQTYGISHVE